MLHNKFNNKVKPGDNFDEWVNGIWKKNNPIPKEYNRWGSFDILKIENDKKIQTILNSESNIPFSNRVKILWTKGLDMNERNKISIDNEIKLLIDNVNNLTHCTISEYIFEYLMMYQLKAPMSVYSYTDMKNSNKNVLYITSSGLGLPDRDYYFIDSKKEIRDEYIKFIEQINKCLGWDIKSDNILKIETILAKHTRTKTEKRDPDLKYNPTTIEELKQKYVNINWDYLFKKINKKPNKIIVTNPYYIKQLNQLIVSMDITIWKNYLKWCIITTLAPYLNDKIININFEFYGKKISGIKQLKDISKQTIDQINNHLGEIVGRIYVEKYFPECSKNKVCEMIGYLQKELKKRILKLDWMCDSTKEIAIEKLNKFGIKIGYPDKWTNYSDLELNVNKSYLYNILQCRKWDITDNLKQLYKPVDKNKWHMNPHTVNAYYSPSSNEIVFPAAILQPPFFSPDYDAPLNFGAIGTIIGHEMTHGFDDQGRKFDPNGNLKMWWTKKDSEHFNKKTSILIEQFNNTKINGKKINGKLTLGENIADLGGIKISFYAFKEHMKKNKLKNLEGFTPEQRFFIAYAKIWRSNIRNKELLNRLITDPHAPPETRVNIPLRNFEEWYKHFNIDENCKNYCLPDARAYIW